MRAELLEHTPRSNYIKVKAFTREPLKESRPLIPVDLSTRLPGPAEAAGAGAGPRHQEHLKASQRDLTRW